MDIPESRLEVGYGTVDGPRFSLGSSESSETYPFTGAILEGALTAPMNWFYNQLDNEDPQTRSPSTVRFMLQVCAGHGEDEHSCDTICGNAGTMFGSPEVMWNCMTLASIWQASRTNDSISGKTLVRQLEKGISVDKPFDVSIFDGLGVLQRVYECAEKSCRIDGDECGYSFSFPQGILDGDFSHASPFLDSSFCDGVRAVANIDIAGPGIYMSLLFQTAMGTYIWIMSLLFIARTIIDSVAYVLRFGGYYDINEIPKHFVVPPSRLSAIITYLETANFFQATNSFIVDFAEAQSFYVIAIAVAIIYADSQGAIFNGANNYPSVFLNQTITASVIFSAVVPIIVVQLALHRISMDSIYTLVISTTALVLASVAATKTEGSASVGKVRSMLAKDAALPECGGNPSLRAMCEAATAGVRESTRSEYAVPSYVALTCLVVLGYLWYLKILRRRLYRWAQSFFDSVLPETRRTSGSWASRLPILKKLLWLYRGMLKLPLFVFQLILAVWMSLSLQSIIAEVKASSEEDYDRPWNLGQVIALLAWVPVIAKYMYSLTFGLENGFMIRLSKLFTIVRRPEGSDGEKPAGVNKAVSLGVTVVEGGEYHALRDLDAATLTPPHQSNRL